MYEQDYMKDDEGQPLWLNNYEYRRMMKSNPYNWIIMRQKMMKGECMHVDGATTIEINTGSMPLQESDMLYWRESFF